MVLRGRFSSWFFYFPSYYFQADFSSLRIMGKRFTFTDCNITRTYRNMILLFKLWFFSTCVESRIMVTKEYVYYL